MRATVTGLGSYPDDTILPGYPHRAWPINPEQRDGHQARVSSVVCPNGTVAATAHPTLAAAFTRAVLDQWDAIRAERAA